MAEVRTTSATGGQKGTKLARFDLIPANPLREVAEHFGMGALKYDNHQWRQGYEWSKSIAAKSRHDNAFEAGLDYDVCSNDPDGCSFVDADGNEYVPVRPDTCYNHTGSHHMAASAWHALVLLEFKDRFPGFDDRYNPAEDDEKYRRAQEPQPEPVGLLDVETWDRITEAAEAPSTLGDVWGDTVVKWSDPVAPTIAAKADALEALGFDEDPTPGQSLARAWMQTWDEKHRVRQAVEDAFLMQIRAEDYGFRVRFIAGVDGADTIDEEHPDYGPDLLRKHAPRQK